MDGLDSLFPLKSHATADVIVDVLRTRILDGQLAPGAHVNEVRFAARLDVSRGPVREAVQRLVQEGLLTRSPNKGTRVVDLDLDDVADIYQARAAVEREAALVLLDDPPDALLADLEGVLRDMADAVAGGTWHDVSLVDLRFHQTIVDTAGSPRLSKFFNSLVAESLLCIRSLEVAYQARDRLTQQHRSLTDLLRARDRDGYLNELDWHLKNSVVTLSKALE